MHGNILLHGPYGTGKSATALAVVAQRRAAAGYDGPYIYRHSGADLDNDGKVLVNSIAMACMTEPGWQPYLVVDEIDQFSKRGQAYLAHLLETTASLRLIMTTNNIAAVDGKIQSRSDSIFVAPAGPNEWLPRVQSILRSEGVRISDAAALGLIGDAEDARRILRTLEACIVQHRIANASPAAGPTQPALPAAGPPVLVAVPGNSMVTSTGFSLPMTTSLRILGGPPNVVPTTKGTP